MTHQGCVLSLPLATGGRGVDCHQILLVYANLQGCVGPWYLHTQNNIHRTVEMSGMTLFTGG